MTSFTFSKPISIIRLGRVLGGQVKREEWDHSTLDACEVSMEFKSKIHFNMIYSRHNADGTTYRTAPGHWIVAKKDGRWGVQLKSY